MPYIRVGESESLYLQLVEAQKLGYPNGEELVRGLEVLDARR